MSALAVPGWARAVLRVVRLVAILLIVASLCFLSMQLLPGDPARQILGPTNATPEAVAELRHQLGLDRPLGARFADWVGGVLQGDLGSSYRTGQSVTDIIAERVPVTVELVVFSQLIALALAVPAAIAAATRRRTGVDRGISLWVFTTLSMPNFVIGVLLIWVLSVSLGWLPSNGYTPWSEDPARHLASMIMPSIALAAAPFALYQRVLRADLVETLSRDFMAVARAKGVSPARIIVRHALRPSLLGLSTSVGVTVGTLIGSTVVVESLFGLPGLGAELVSAVQGRDYVEVQGIVLVIAVAFVLINRLVDVLYGVLDPRLGPAGTPAAGGAG
ncbi:ABC transporter permease [Actinomadura sp. 1N219]|uniref:ABC transporter permease n=1 Tax=Actinomadura sp. 1N219 TaxID=3375152 RepID=UPI00379A6D9C